MESCHQNLVPCLYALLFACVPDHVFLAVSMQPNSTNVRIVQTEHTQSRFLAARRVKYASLKLEEESAPELPIKHYHIKGNGMAMMTQVYAPSLQKKPSTPPFKQ